MIKMKKNVKNCSNNNSRNNNIKNSRKVSNKKSSAAKSKRTVGFTTDETDSKR